MRGSEEKQIIDGKAIESYAQGKKNPAEGSDPEADWGAKTYKGKGKDGSPWEKIVSWFGYKLHLLVDTTYELPVGLWDGMQRLRSVFGRDEAEDCEDTAWDRQADICADSEE